MVRAHNIHPGTCPAPAVSFPTGHHQHKFPARTRQNVYTWYHLYTFDRSDFASPWTDPGSAGAPVSF
jgi:hypothetical protein